MSAANIRVAHVLRRFTRSEWGGTESVVWNTVLQLRARGADPEILTTSALSKPGEEWDDGVRIRRFPYWYPYFPMTGRAALEMDKKGGNPFSPGLFRALKKGRFDLIHIHCGGRLSVMCALTAHRLGIPCVISLHGGFAAVPDGELKNMMAPARGRFHYGGIIDRIAGYRRNAVAESDAVICISRAEERLLKEQFPDRRIVYLPNGVNCDEFAQKPSSTPQAEWRIPADRRLILCISRIDYQKNQKILLEILRKDPNSHLLLLGPVTSPWYCEEVKNRAKELGVADRLTVIPGLPPGDPRLKAVLHEADLFVLPSLHEPFGIVALEAWAAGLPVLASGAGGLADFITPERNGLFFDPEKPESLVCAYERLIGDPGLRENLIAHAQEDVRAFSWPALTDRLLNLYGELLHEKR
ncbi:MAG: glycosyltransferase family 4 protein [Lentisphaeria bacterium]|nr:glycosyltransferase family 4 protein [Lentisphaeria bacterium]